MTRRIVVTAALPYANGHIHIGHLLEHIQTDIWARFQRLRGNRTLFICADDTHGTAIMIRARQEQRSEEALIAEMSEAHLRDFAGFGISFDHYGSTHSESNREQCHAIWNSLREAGLVNEKAVTQLFDTEAGTFLADRFVQGTCPVCKSEDQYGDNCDKCMATYTPAELIDPVSTLSGTKPELRTADHLFVNIEQLHEFLEEWTQSGEHLQPEVANYLKGHFLGDPLRDWDISRPAPYFGFEVPDSPGNYWYVWFDAPIGYVAATADWCEANNESLADWWKNSETEVHHFIGKDITYFHTLFWPAMLKTAGLNLPDKVHIHGFVTVDNTKMSKTKGTFIQASTYLKHLNPAWLRYYYASKLGPRLDDLDLNLDEFLAKVNSDLVGKVVNLASRSAKFVQEQQLADAYPEDEGLFQAAADRGESIADAYERCDYSNAMREIMALADAANRYIEEQRPWELRKAPEQAEQLRDVCTVALNLFRQIVIYLTPVLPELSRQTGQLLNAPIQSWVDATRPLVGTRVNRFEHLMKRVEKAQVDAMIEDSREEQASESVPTFNDGPEALEKEPMTEEQCTFEDFMKVDMRVARVIEAEHVKDANKLLRLTLSLGGDEQRNVFAGIKSVYEPQELLGQLVVCCANLAPRKMRFGVSEGMVLACGPGGQEIYILKPDSGAVPGQRVH